MDVQTKMNTSALMRLSISLSYNELLLREKANGVPKISCSSGHKRAAGKPLTPRVDFDPCSARRARRSRDTPESLLRTHLNSVLIGTAAIYAVSILFSLCVALVRSGIALRARHYKENRNEEIADYEYVFSSATSCRLLRGTTGTARATRLARSGRSA
jgi:hypothetical protein